MTGDDDPWETVPASDDADGAKPVEDGATVDADGADDDAGSGSADRSDDGTEEGAADGTDADAAAAGTNADATADGTDEDTTDDETRATVVDDAGGSGDDGATPAASGTAPDFDDGDQVLRTENLTKQFGELVAVDGVDLSLARGEFRSVIGPNGAGKTTLFNLITGGLSPTRGTVYFDGESVNGLAPHERVRRGLGRSFQITNIFGGLTVRENVRLAAQSVRRDDISPIQRLLRSKDDFPEVNEVTDRVLGRIGLEAHAGERAATLAYGDQRRLEIGLVLATDPQVVLLDEPTAGMGLDETRETMELIDEVLADRTLVLIEHDIDLVMDVSDRVTVLHRGSVLATGTPHEVSEDESVQEAYLGGAGQ